MIQSHLCAGEGIAGFRCRQFVAVAALTSPRKIIQIIRAAADAGMNMLDSVGAGRKIRGTPAVFAEVPGPLGDKPPCFCKGCHLIERCRRQPKLRHQGLNRHAAPVGKLKQVWKSLRIAVLRLLRMP